MSRDAFPPPSARTHQTHENKTPPHGSAGAASRARVIRLRQQFELLGGTVNGVGANAFAGVSRNVFTGDPCDPFRPGPFVTDWANSTTNPPLGGFLQNIPNLADPNQSWDLFYQHNLIARARGFRRVSGLGWCDCFIFSGSTHQTFSQGMSFIGSYVDSDGALFAQWRNMSQSVTHNTDHSGRGNAASVNDFTIVFRVTGVPDGTPVTVYHRHNTTALGWTRHESGGEDPILLQFGHLCQCHHLRPPPMQGLICSGEGKWGG